MKKNSALLLSVTGLVVLPVAAYAAGAQDLSNSFISIGISIDSLRDNIVTGLVSLFAVMAMAAFFWGLVEYIWGRRDGKEDKIKEGNRFMVWSLVALFVMFSIWGIISFFQGILLPNQNPNRLIMPDIQVGNSGGSGYNSNPLNSSPNTNTTGLTPVSGSGPSGASNPYVGADCVVDRECQGGTVCIQYQCQVPSGAYNRGCDPQDPTC